MSYESVNLYVRDKDVPESPIEEVVVRIYGPDRKYVHGQAMTDVNGVASFLLPVGTYEVRLYRFATAFKNPTYIEVLESPAENGFTLYGEPLHHPQATDPRLCVASGYFRTPSGGVARSVDMHFIAKFDPVILEGSAVLTERVTQRTDERGYAELSLIRCAEYDVTVEGIENFYRSVSVPDQPWVNLPDLLFPRVKVVEFSPVPEGDEISVDSGNEVVYDVRVGTTDRRWLPDLTSDVVWTVGDPSIAAITLSATTITIRGLSAGTTTLRATRKDSSIITIPDTAIEGAPIVITVT